MSEDQLRKEQLDYRKENREDHQSIMEMINAIKKETVEAVKEENKLLIATNDKILKSYRYVVKWAGIIMVCFFGWLALGYLGSKETLKELQTDFGIILFIAPKDHSESTMFDEIRDKYNPKRGPTKKSSTKDSIFGSAIIKKDEEDLTL